MTSHELSSKFTNFYVKQKATHDLKADHVIKMLNDGSKRKFLLLEKSRSLKLTANDNFFSYEVQEELQSRVLTQS